MELAETQRVLLVEGDAALRRVIALGLRNQGITVLEAASVQHAHTLLDQQPSLLILDIDSGVASDRMLLSELRTYDGLASVPALVLAWDCSPEVGEQINGDVAAICLVKPFDARRLFTEVETLLKTTRQSRKQQLVAASVAQPVPVTKEQPATAIAASAAGPMPVATQTALGEPREVAQASPPSIWPFVLALGLMLVAGGLLIHPAMVILGMLVAFGAILLWSFEPGSPRPGEA